MDRFTFPFSQLLKKHKLTFQAEIVILSVAYPISELQRDPAFKKVHFKKMRH